MTDVDRFADLLESDQDDPEIQYQLGLCYLNGEGVARDGRMAEKWLRWAADQGHDAARQCLEAVQPSKAQAPKKLTKETLPDWCLLAEDGDAEAQYQVAQWFLTHSAKTSKQDAERYLQMAVEQGHPEACLALAKQRLKVKRYEEAMELLNNAADCALPEAMDLLAQCYGHGLGTEKNLQKAEEWFISAAERGGGEQMLALALRFAEGNLVEESYGKALSWMRRAQNAGVQDAEQRFNASPQAQREAERLRREREQREKEEAERLRQEREQQEKEEAERLRREREQQEKDALRRKMEDLENKANQGNAKAAFALAEVFRTGGSGVDKSVGQATKWYQKAAELGHDEAAFALAEAFRSGQGVKKDFGTAVQWYQRAADGGSANAQYALGRLYEDGSGVPRDLDKAVALYRQAADKNQPSAQYRLGLCCQLGQGLPQSQEQAASWYQKAALAGHAEAQNDLALLYYWGEGIPRDYGQAIRWFRKAAKKGNRSALYGLGYCYEQGLGVEKSTSEAFKRYLQAANKNHVEAQYALGLCYLQGQGAAVKPSSAVKWFRKAADQGHMQAQAELGRCYEQGHGLNRDLNQAIIWYQKAADQGSPAAKTDLKRCQEALATQAALRQAEEAEAARRRAMEAEAKARRQAAEAQAARAAREKAIRPLLTGARNLWAAALILQLAVLVPTLLALESDKLYSGIYQYIVLFSPALLLAGLFAFDLALGERADAVKAGYRSRLPAPFQTLDLLLRGIYILLIVLGGLCCVVLAIFVIVRSFADGFLSFFYYLALFAVLNLILLAGLLYVLVILSLPQRSGGPRGRGLHRPDPSGALAGNLEPYDLSGQVRLLQYLYKGKPPPCRRMGPDSAGIYPANRTGPQQR